MISISSPGWTRPWRTRWTASGPAAEPVAGSSETPAPGANMRVFHALPEPAKQLIPRHLAELGQARHVRSQRRDVVRGRQAHVHVAHAVVVELDRELGALDADRGEQRLRVVERLDRRERLRHPPEHDPRTLALEQDGNDAGARLEQDLDELQRAAEHERGAERRMPGERDLDRRREDAHARVPAVLGRIDEHRLGVVHLPRERLQRVLGQVARVGEDGELVALERRVREDVADDVAEPGHAGNLLPGPGANPEALATAWRTARTAGRSRSTPTPPCCTGSGRGRP